MKQSYLSTGLVKLPLLLAVLRSVASRELRASSSSSSSSSGVPSEWITGIATNYGGPSEGKDPSSPSFGTHDGSCGYGDLNQNQYPYWSVAALSTQNRFYKAGPASGCGQCFEIQCINSGGKFAGRCNADPNQDTVTVQISDSCPECEADHIDMQALTFNKIAPMLNGRIDIKYRRVQCTPPANINVQIDGNSGTGGWLRLSVTTVGNSGAIKSVQVKGPNSQWKGLNNIWGATWEIANQPSLPIDLHVTADNGQELTAFKVITKNKQMGVIKTDQQFDFNGPASYNQASSIDSHLTSASASSSSSSDDSSSSSSASSSSSSGSGASSSSTSNGASSSSGSNEGSYSGISSSLDSSSGSSPSGDSSVSAYGGPASDNSCTDVAPTGGKGGSCKQQKQWGKCSAAWMKQTVSGSSHGYCAKTCGRC